MGSSSLPFASTSASSASSCSFHHHHHGHHHDRHRHTSRRTVPASLLFLVTILVSTCSSSSSNSVLGSSAVVVVVASFSPSTTISTTTTTATSASSISANNNGNNNGSRNSKGLLGRTRTRTNPAFGGGGGRGGGAGTGSSSGKRGSTSSLGASQKTSSSSKSNSNEGIEQNSKAYTRLYEKSVPSRERRDEQAEEQEGAEAEATNDGESDSDSDTATTVLSMANEEEEATIDSEISSATTMAVAAVSEFCEQNKNEEMHTNNAVAPPVPKKEETNTEISGSPKEEEQQQQQQQSPPYLATLSGGGGEDNEPAAAAATKSQLQAQLLSKDAMYQNQIDALTEQASASIHALEADLTVLQHEYSNYQSHMTEQLTTAQVTASEKEHALFREMTTLLSKLEEEQVAGVQSAQRVEQLQQEMGALQQQITAMQQEYTSTLHDLEDDYELEQNARTKDRAEHVSELLRVRQEAVAHVEAVERGANEHTDRVRVEYNRRHVEQQQAMESVQVKLTTVQSSLRDREDLIAEWAADRSSAKTMTRQVWQLLKGRVVARVRRIKSRLTLWFSDEAP